MLSNLEIVPVSIYLDDDRCLMWDNIYVYKTANITHVIHSRESHNYFHVVNRPPYRPNIAPIESNFYELKTAELGWRVKPEWNISSLRCHIYDICSKIGRNTKFPFHIYALWISTVLTANSSECMLYYK